MEPIRNYIFRQGDQGRVFFKVVFGQSLFEDYLIDDIEVCIEKFVRLTKKDGNVIYHPDLQSFSFLLSQEDTEFLKPGVYSTLIRVKLRDFDGTQQNLIRTVDGPFFKILPGFSKEII